MRPKDITCVSDLYYIIGLWFTFGMWTLCFITLPFALWIWDSVFSFLLCAGIAFVGTASNYRDKTEYPIHYLSAMTSALCSVIWVTHVEPCFLWVLTIALMGLIDKKRWLLWCELPCFIMVYTTLFYTLC